MNNQNAIEAIQAVYDDLYGQEKKVADYVIAHGTEAAKMTVTELAEASAVSEATVMRLSKKAGFKGFYHLKLALAQQASVPTITPSETKIDSKNMSAAVSTLLAAKAADLQAVSSSVDDGQVETALARIKQAATLYIFAAGNTNNLAAYAAYLFNQLGVKTVNAPLPEMQVNLAYQMTVNDACLLISQSGSTTLTTDIAQVAHDYQVPSIAITREDKSPLTQLVDTVLLSPQSQQVTLQIAGTTQLTEMAVVDLLIMLLAADESGQYANNGVTQENRLAKYKY